MAEIVAPPATPSVGRLLLGSGPRFLRDSLAPVVVFYAGWKLFGLTPAIAAATGLAVAMYGWERRKARSGLAAAMGLGIALTQAAAALATGSAVAYFVPGVIANALYGLAFVVSVLIGRPLAACSRKTRTPSRQR